MINSNPESQDIEASDQSNALEQEVRLEEVFVGDVIESDESDLSSQEDLSTSALPVFTNGTASTARWPMALKQFGAARISAPKAMSEG